MSTKPILVLDDDIERHNMFSKWIGTCFDSYFNAETLLRKLRANEITATVLFLDHDLGSGMDGTGLLRTMEAENIQLPSVKRICIHSNNNVRNTDMCDTLHRLYPNIESILTPITSMNSMWEDYNKDKLVFQQALLST